MDNRFFHIRFERDQYLTSGPSSCFFGHSIKSADAPPDGIFSSWNWDGEDLTVQNDRYGIYPLYYFADKNEICVSPSLPALLTRGAPRELDYSALAVFFRLGYFLGESTPFRAIHALPPHAQFKWNKGGVNCTAEYPKIGWSGLSRDEAIEAYIELFAAAVRRRVPKESNGVLLSGGRDSRHIVFELCRQGRAPDLVSTIEVPRNDDLEMARSVAKRLSIPHRWVPAPRPSLAAERRNMYETNFCADEHSWILDLLDDLTGNTSSLWDGLAGDVLSAGLFLNETGLNFCRTGLLTEFARQLIGGEDRYLKSSLRPAFYRLVSNEIALERIQSELERHVAAPNPVGSFIFWNRTRREIALVPFGLFRNFTVYVPYLDHQLFDLLTSLPAEMLVDHKFHDDTIARAYPEWTHLPYSQKSKTSRSSGLGWVSWLDILARRSHWVNTEYLLPRCLRAACVPGYGDKAMYLIKLPLYLREIENLADQRSLVTFDAPVAPTKTVVSDRTSLG